MRTDDFRYGGRCHRKQDHHYSRRMYVPRGPSAAFQPVRAAYRPGTGRNRRPRELWGGPPGARATPGRPSGVRHRVNCAPRENVAHTKAACTRQRQADESVGCDQGSAPHTYCAWSDWSSGRSASGPARAGGARLGRQWSLPRVPFFSSLECRFRMHGRAPKVDYGALEAVKRGASEGAGVARGHERPDLLEGGRSVVENDSMTSFNNSTSPPRG